MKDENCIFCKLANGEIPTATLYEDEDFRVILDASPASKGHALIIPKEHYANLYELDDELAGKALVLAKKMITKLTGILDCDGYNIVEQWRVGRADRIPLPYAYDSKTYWRRRGPGMEDGRIDRRR